MRWSLSFICLTYSVHQHSNALMTVVQHITIHMNVTTVDTNRVTSTQMQTERHHDAATRNYYLPDQA